MKTQHTNDTALRALEILKLLFAHEMTTEELSFALQEKTKSDTVFRSDTLYKYLNTFKLFGICPTKNGTKYSLLNLPFCPQYPDETKAGLEFVLELAKKMFMSADYKRIEAIVKRLSHCSSNYSFETLEKHSTIIRQTYPEFFERTYDREEFYKYRDICKANQKITFKYNNRILNITQTITAEPKEVILTPNGCVLKVYNIANAENQDLPTSDISELEQLPSRTKSSNVKRAVTFKIKGRLARSYELKIGEREIDSQPEYKVIINEDEDPNILLRRLLRYGTNCEILYPQDLREEALNLLNKIRANYS